MILSGGTYQTPQILMLSGIGPAEELEFGGIPPVTDLPVGRGMQDHLAILAGSVWVSGISLQRIDPQTNRVAGTVDVNATSANAGFGSLWITDIFGRVERINP